MLQLIILHPLWCQFVGPNLLLGDTKVPLLCKAIADNQCDQIGIFIKCRSWNFTYKLLQIIGNFLGWFETRYLYSKTCCCQFWGRFCKNWATFNSDIWSLCWQSDSWIINVKRSWNLFQAWCSIWVLEPIILKDLNTPVLCSAENGASNQ